MGRKGTGQLRRAEETISGEGQKNIRCFCCSIHSVLKKTLMNESKPCININTVINILEHPPGEEGNKNVKTFR